ncbi:HAMP domain-containing sensor histidine kinase [Alteromonas sp. KUL49]|uniref:sensor histidine kinase n=1 Tax=Alteromonas sp. KUL49 TaxID=2480798 RepID=UPI00102EE4C8|nr:HAMP domain-containing sensor histidine kinase [Alteromonas sp. KUL49]TAP38627.1 HAMP domain-containing histidine kinase [Alteromonas sp. KUL49]GEA12569.1 two-component sensor histidine kinase [Alteromonas sp. KUL49]
MSRWNKPKGFHSLSRRIVIQFCAFTLLLSAAYGFVSFMLMYNLEDGFIERNIQQEAQFLKEGYQKSGQWPVPRQGSMSLHFSKSTFPDDMRNVSLTEPKRVEFYGDSGRHYHLYTFPEFNDTYLLAEVSNDLMIRPVRTGLMQFLGIIAAVLTAISCFVAWLISRRMTKPLRQLADKVDGVAPNQIPSKFAHQYPRNEIGVLSHALEHTFSRINQALSREAAFTRDVSHELRSPLAVIKNAAELHRSIDISKAQSEEIVKRIEDAAERMDKTVHTLLTLAREESAQSPKVVVNLLSIVERAVIDNGGLLKGKPIEVVISDSCNSQIEVREGMLKVLLDNLLSNAFQYTEQGEVSVNYEHGKLTVSDTGPGIQSDITDKVTEPSVQGKQSTGFGFGLSIVKRLCEHQGWALTIESGNQEQAGTQITVRMTGELRD